VVPGRSPLSPDPGRRNSRDDESETAPATIAVEEYPSLTTAVPLFTLATAVGVSRIAADEHWTGDVLASAALGVVIGHILYRVHARPSDNWSMDIGSGMVQITRCW